MYEETEKNPKAKKKKSATLMLGVGDTHTRSHTFTAGLTLRAFFGDLC